MGVQSDVGSLASVELEMMKTLQIFENDDVEHFESQQRILDALNFTSMNFFRLIEFCPPQEGEFDRLAIEMLKTYND